MALSALELNAIQTAIQTAQKLVQSIKPVVDELDIIYNSSGGASTTITQPNLDATPSLSGLTKSQLDDAMYALTATLKGGLVSAYTAIATLAARYPSPFGG